jgi:hypothetical protein
VIRAAFAWGVKYIAKDTARSNTLRTIDKDLLAEIRINKFVL